MSVSFSIGYSTTGCVGGRSKVQRRNLGTESSAHISSKTSAWALMSQKSNPYL